MWRSSGIRYQFSIYFSSLVGVLDECDSDVIEEIPVCGYEFSFNKVEEEDVLALLRSLEVNKATGSDGLSAKLLQTCAFGISSSLTSLLNYSLESGQVPQEWKLANITPVSKGVTLRRLVTLDLCQCFQ